MYSKIERFGCGCIGIKFDDDNVLLLRECNEGIEQFTLTHNHILSRNFKDDYLHGEELEEFVKSINSLICDGGKFRELRSLLK